MPSVEWNKSVWNGRYDWKTGGEEWSETWGGSEAQWFGALYPRLHRLLPARSIVEIAPGCGRWSKYLIPLSDHYVGIDLSQHCVDECRRIFANATHATFIANDGLSITSVIDGSCDFLFSFDSLVHAELQVLQSYICEAMRVLSVDGVAFIHHSNLLSFGGCIGTPHVRAPSVSAEKVAEAISVAGGHILVQEVINWGGQHQHDCLTTFGKRRPSESVFLSNGHFMNEASIIRDFHAPYNKVSRSFSKPPT
jgi:hypothetical protein